MQARHLKRPKSTIHYFLVSLIFERATRLFYLPFALLALLSPFNPQAQLKCIERVQIARLSQASKLRFHARCLCGCF